MNIDALQNSLNLIKAGVTLPESYNKRLRGWRLWVLRSTKYIWYLAIIAILLWVIL